jgi:Helix-turn-helix domain/Family of unknown function (DUF6186)
VAVFARAHLVGTIGWVVILVALVVWEAVGLMVGRGWPTLSHITREVTRSPVGRWVLFGAWLWLGWHLFIRGWQLFLRGPLAQGPCVEGEVVVGQSCRQIAARLGRAPSTVSRELTRNGGRHHYRAQAADAAALRRALRPKPAKLAVQPRLRAVVEAKLARRWSPQQIAGWLPLAYPSDPVLRVSHERIYLSLFVQGRGALRRELQRCLRTGRAMRSPRAKRLPRAAASCATPSIAASDPPRRPPGRCLGIGKATWSSAAGPARSAPWSSATAAMCGCFPWLMG